MLFMKTFVNGFWNFVKTNSWQSDFLKRQIKFYFISIFVKDGGVFVEVNVGRYPTPDISSGVRILQ